MGLIPRSWATDGDNYTRDGLILGAWKNNRIQVGIVGSYEAMKTLIEDYREDAAEVYFPFPRPLSGPPGGNTFMRKLVLVFDRAGLERAAKRASSELSREISHEISRDETSSRASPGKHEAMSTY
jgi:hypothetical protein